MNIRTHPFSKVLIVWFLVNFFVKELLLAAYKHNRSKGDPINSTNISVSVPRVVTGCCNLDDFRTSMVSAC